MGRKSNHQKQREQQRTTKNKVVLLNENLYSLVLTAGTDVNKFNRLADKSEQQLDLLEVSIFGFDIVKSQNVSIDVKAKCVCGSCHIYLISVQNVLTRLLGFDQKLFKGRKIGYKEKNVVRQFDVEVLVGRDNPLKLPANAEEYLEMEFETEKDVIEALLSCQQSTMVQNVEDITLRELPTGRPIEEYDTLNMMDDFGEAGSNELLNAFNDSAEQQDTGLVSLTALEPVAPLPDDLMDIDPSGGSESEANRDPNSHLLPLEETMQPTPMEVGEDDLDELQPLESIDSFYDFDDDSSNIVEASENHSTSDNLEREAQRTVAAPGHSKKRSRVIVDAFTQLSTNCLMRRMTLFAETNDNSWEQLRQETLASHAEQHLHRLFTEPLRPFRHSFLYERHLTVRQKGKAPLGELEFNNSKSSKKAKLDTGSSKNDQQPVAVTEGSVLLARPTATDAPTMPAEPLSVPDAVQTVSNDFPTSVESFLTRFTGDPSQWDYLKQTEKVLHKQKDDKEDDGVVTCYTLTVVLRSLFQEVGDEPIPFEKIQAKMGNRLIAASLFARLLVLSATKVIRIASNEAGLPAMVHKFQNWK